MPGVRWTRIVELQYAHIEVALSEALPELRPAAECYWSIEGRPGEDSGAYIFYEDMFGKYLEILLALDPSPGRDRLLKRAFCFVDEMLKSTDAEVANLAYVALLEGRDPWWLTRGKPFFGPLAISALDTWFKEWRPSVDSHWTRVPWPGASYVYDPYSVRLVVASELSSDGVPLERIPGWASDTSDKAT
jgi:hypothetical protein